MKLFSDACDLADAKKLRDRRFEWLQELGAEELAKAKPDDVGFLFGYEYGESQLAQQVKHFPGIHDRPAERQELVKLDDVLRKLSEHRIEVPTPKTWVIGVDEDLPTDLSFPLFVRTPKSSWKRGGQQGKVRNLRELNEEAELLRRAFGWDCPIIVREWLEIASAGKWMFGDVPQEVRVWIVDQIPVAWSFHYLHAVSQPKGFPPNLKELDLLEELARKVASPFQSRLIAADFVRDRKGNWHFLEAGPGAVSGTAHEAVFKFVAQKLQGHDPSLAGDAVGGKL